MAGRVWLMVALGALISVAQSAAAEEFRTWTDVTGKFQTEGQFIGCQDGKVRLKTKKGTTVVVPLARLSQADQDYVAVRSPAAAARPGDTAAPSPRTVAEYLAGRLLLEALLKDDPINQMSGLRPPVIAALARVPKLRFEQRVAWGLLLMPMRGSPELEETERRLRFATAEALVSPEFAAPMIGVRKGELALFAKEGYDRPVQEELRLIESLSPVQAKAVRELAGSPEVKGLVAVRDKLADHILKALEADAAAKELADGEARFDAAASAELRTARERLIGILAVR